MIGQTISQLSFGEQTLVAALAIGLAACSPDPPPDSKQELFSLPEPNVVELSPSVAEQIEKAFERANAQRQNADAVGQYGMLLHAYEQRESAIKCYERAIVLAPENLRWIHYLGTAQSALGREAAAADSFRAVLSLKPGFIAAMLRLAEALLAANQLAESQELCRQVIKLEPESPAAYYVLGRALATQGKTTEALHALHRSADLAPNAGAVHYALAMAHRDAGDAEKSRQHLALFEEGNRAPPPKTDPLDEALRALRTDKHWLLNEGRRLEADGQVESAREHYEKTLEIDPSFAQAHINLMAVYGRLGEFDKAEHHYKAALGSNPRIEELHTNWGIIQALQNHLRQAAASFRKTLEINPRNSDAHFNLGSILQQQGETGAALEHLRAALRENPNHRLANLHLGRYLVAQGQFDEGIRHLRKTLAPEDERTPGMLYALADAYLRAGRREDGIESARKAIELAQRSGQKELAATIQRDLNALHSPGR